MRVLLVGSGGREHAIACELVKSPLVDELLCAPGNAGIARIARVFPDVKATNLDGMVQLAIAEKVDFVVVAPDDPLALGMVDRIEEAGIAAFGPTGAAARIESSKVFSKALMKKYGIPTAEYQEFDDANAAMDYIREKGAPIVVKADGLALGKGVTVAQSIEEAIGAVQSIMEDAVFGASGNRIVIEECMSGPEVTQLAFCDGRTLKLMPSSQDHKRAFEDDKGPNTGGMGAIAPCPLFTEDVQLRAVKEIFAPTVQMLLDEGIPFRGVIYFGLMLTKDGPKVIEYNARFGDPETQAVLPLLQTDLMEIFMACREGRLDKLQIDWSQDSCACVALASGGYPVEYKTGYAIAGLPEAEEMGGIVYHAGTAEGRGDLQGKIVTGGGRVLGISYVAPMLSQAIEGAYQAAKCIRFEGMQYRSDIGKRYL